jgi:hypothetical protein
MAFKERKKQNSMVTSKAVANERNKKQHKTKQDALYVSGMRMSHMLLACTKSRNWRMKFLNAKWPTRIKRSVTGEY